MDEFTTEFVDKIALTCIQLYNKIPKIGKPAAGEWAVLSCIVQLDTTNQRYHVVSLGTGTKCIGATKMSPDGIKVNDSHAEVFARRGFMLYIYKNIEKAISNTSQESIFVKENGQFRLKDNIEFVFYSSQMPCGDASIIPKCNENDHGYIITSRKREGEAKNDDIESKRVKSDNNDIHRTGAKCLPNNKQDPKEPGTKYHLLGQVRTKPGQGDRTLSVSCSDKIARWIHVGIQGALLGMLLTKPIYIKHFIFGGGVPYSKESLIRAFLNRNGEEQITVPITPYIYQATAIFDHMKSEQRTRPSPGSVLLLNFGVIEVAVQGKKLGVTKKMEKTKKISLCISKYYLYCRFLNILQSEPSLREAIADGELESIPYNVMKRKSQIYYDNWYKVRDHFFKSWTVKPDMWSFCISSKDLAENLIDLEKRIHVDLVRTIML